MPITSKLYYSLENDVTCSICMEIFNKPRILSCQHTFCLECLECLEKSLKTKKKCPICNTELLLEVKEYPVNFNMNTQIENFKAFELERKQKKAKRQQEKAERQLEQKQIKEMQEALARLQEEKNQKVPIVPIEAVSIIEVKDEVKQEGSHELESKQEEPIEFSVKEELIVSPQPPLPNLNKSAETIIEEKIFQCGLISYSQEKLKKNINSDKILDQLNESVLNGNANYLLTKEMCGDAICTLMFATYLKKVLCFDIQKKDNGDYEISWLNCENRVGTVAGEFAKKRMEILFDAPEKKSMPLNVTKDFINAVKEIRMNQIETLLKNNPSLSEIVLNESFPLFAITYQRSSKNLKKMRQLFFQYGANINYQNATGETLGHIFAKKILTHNEFNLCEALITWINEGGDLLLKDNEGACPLEMVMQMKSNIQDPLPGFDCVSAILLGLNRERNLQRPVVEELKNFSKKEIKHALSKFMQEPHLKMAYQSNEIMFRVFKEFLFEMGADINIEGPCEEGGGTLGHQFAMEAANRNDQKSYLRLIQWISDGGDVSKKDKHGHTPVQRLIKFSISSNEFLFPGLWQTVAILENVKIVKLDSSREKNILNFEEKSIDLISLKSKIAQTIPFTDLILKGKLSVKTKLYPNRLNSSQNEDDGLQKEFPCPISFYKRLWLCKSKELRTKELDLLYQIESDLLQLKDNESSSFKKEIEELEQKFILKENEIKKIKEGIRKIIKKIDTAPLSIEEFLCKNSFIGVDLKKFLIWINEFKENFSIIQKT